MKYLYSKYLNHCELAGDKDGEAGAFSAELALFIVFALAFVAAIAAALAGAIPALQQAITEGLAVGG